MLNEHDNEYDNDNAHGNEALGYNRAELRNSCSAWWRWLTSTDHDDDESRWQCGSWHYAEEGDGLDEDGDAKDEDEHDDDVNRDADRCLYWFSNNIVFVIARTVIDLLGDCA